MAWAGCLPSKHKAWVPISSIRESKKGMPCSTASSLVFSSSLVTATRILGMRIVVRGLSNCAKLSLLKAPSRAPNGWSDRAAGKRGSDHWKGKQRDLVAFVVSRVLLVPSSRGCVLSREAKDKS